MFKIYLIVEIIKHCSVPSYYSKYVSLEYNARKTDTSHSLVINI